MNFNIQYKQKRKILWALLVLEIIYISYQVPRSYALTIVKSKAVDFTKNIDIREGDFIFQHLPGPLTEMIADVTKSPYSHCGIITKKNNKFFVLEAIGPVTETPLNEWIGRGVGQRFTLVRLTEAYQRYVPEIIKAARDYRGRPYDIQYEWDDEKIYCSELIQKAVLKAAGIPLADFVRLGDLDWRPYEKTIRDIAGGALPLQRGMITPGAIADSNYVFCVYSSFPARPSEGIYYALGDIHGFWQGKYYLVRMPLNILIEADEEGGLFGGKLASGLVIDRGLVEKLDPITGVFSCRFVSENNVRIMIDARLDKSKQVIFGRWHDSLGFSGTFLLGKQRKTS